MSGTAFLISIVCINCSGIFSDMTSDLPFPSFTKTWHNASYHSIDPSNPSLSAKGKRIIITGGGSGIGVEIVQSFAKANATAIAILGRTESTLKATKDVVEAQFPHISILPIVTDIADEDSVRTAASRIKADFTEWDVLVCNAACSPEITTLENTKTADWFRGFEVNVKGNYLLAREFLPFAAARDAVLLHISSGVCHIPPMPGLSSYAPSKLASNRFFEYVQDEYPLVRITNIHPGVVETEMYKQLSATGKKLPLDDVNLAANFILWAASAEAKFAKGRMLWSNWDVDELKAKADVITSNSSLLSSGVDGWAAHVPDPDSAVYARVMVGFKALDGSERN